MPETRTPHPFSDNFWSNSSKFVTSSLPISAKKREEAFADLLSAVDESPEFYDPYSDLNLFLSQQIKGELKQCDSSKKWSIKIQEDLLKKIAPLFQKKFPHYRLKLSALKKTWEKVTYYSQQIEHKKEAIAPDGKLNIPFLIKEHLKDYTSMHSPGHLHPSHYAHQMATKMSLCIAAIDGVRPQLDYLTKVIWAVQRHLLTGNGTEQYSSPYDDYDQIDKLIVKTILEIGAKYPQIDHNELKQKVKESLLSLHDLPSLDHIKEWDVIEKKIHIWASQGDMLCRWIHLSSEGTLLRLIEQKYRDQSSLSPHHLFVSEICQEYLKLYPQLTPYSSQLSLRVWILYKYAWYTLFGTHKESSLDRFLKWHCCSLLFSSPTLSQEHLTSKLEEIVSKTLPLVPFDKKQAETILSRAASKD
jgi:hypothetical protein